MRALLTSLLLLAAAQAGEHRYFQLPVGPGGRPSTVHAYIFNSAKETFQVIDQGSLENQLYRDLGDAAQAAGANAAVNGGAFDLQGNPVGLFIANGKEAGSASSGSPTGGLVWSDGNHTGAARSVNFDFKASTATQLLQSDPLLIENGEPVKGLDNARFTRRTVVLTDGGSQWALAYSPGATLEGLAMALAKPGAFLPFRPKFALNLDGGSSSGLWLKRQNGNSFYLHEISKLRNFLVVVPRNQG